LIVGFQTLIKVHIHLFEVSPKGKKKTDNSGSEIMKHGMHIEIKTLTIIDTVRKNVFEKRPAANHSG
jgi:hypothetical protein